MNRNDRQDADDALEGLLGLWGAQVARQEAAERPGPVIVVRSRSWWPALTAAAGVLLVAAALWWSVQWRVAQPGPAVASAPATAPSQPPPGGDDATAMALRQALHVTRQEAQASAEKARQAWQAADAATAQARLAATLLADARQAYLGGGDIASIQAAARRHRLLERLSALRPRQPAGAARDLTDRLEAVLTALNLLDPADADAVETFRRTVLEGGYVAAIDAQIDQNSPPALRQWLLEARFVVEGISHAA